jgi:hypothetical protein
VRVVAVNGLVLDVEAVDGPPSPNGALG